MPLHNWIFGHVFVLFSSNSHVVPGTYVMAPSEYWLAFLELVRLHWGGQYLHRAIVQIGDWLAGSANSAPRSLSMPPRSQRSPMSSSAGVK